MPLSKNSKISSSRFLKSQIASLLLYQSVFNNKVGQAFLYLLQTLDRSDSNFSTDQNAALVCLQAYGAWFQALAEINLNWQDYLIEQILLDDNPFSRQAQRVALAQLPEVLVTAARHDLEILQTIFACSTQQISEWVKVGSQLSFTPIVWELPLKTDNFLTRSEQWTEALDLLAHHYRQQGTGIFAQYQALSWQHGQLVGIAHPDGIQLAEIVGYEAQKEALIQNTEFLLAGYRALHVLLYGSRGSGKSSLVKGLLPKYHDRGLRLVEVHKGELTNLPQILEILRDLPQKFIIFVDDLSFEEDDDAFKALKVVLEGSVTAKARNVVVYATSNRRHLVREFFSDRPDPSDADEVYAWDTMQEKLSFSDRFGLTLTFSSADQDTYLRIVQHLAQRANLAITTEDLEFRAKQWATRHNGRSGRTARQFIDFIEAELALGNITSNNI